MLIPIGFFGGGGGENWISLLGSAGTSESAGRIVSGSDGSVYSAIQSNVSGIGYSWTLVKYTPLGEISWQKTLYSAYLDGISIDNANNIYLSGTGFNSGSPENAFAKFDSSGNLIYQKFYGGGGDQYGGPIAANKTTEEVWSLWTYGTPSKIAMTKFNAAASSDSNANYLYNSSSYGMGASNVYVDSSGNYLFATGYRSDPQSYNHTRVFKFNGSGSVVWQKRYDLPNTNYAYHFASTGDDSGNLYFAHRYSYNGEGDFSGVTKVNSSDGSMAWSKRLGTPPNGGDTDSIAVDPSGNVYVLGGNNETSCGIAKYNSSGVLQWQRKISNVQNYGKIYANNTHFFLNATTTVAGSSDTVTMKFPADGSGTGVIPVGAYSFEYAISNQAVNDAPLNVATINQGYTGYSQTLFNSSRDLVTSTYPQTLAQF